MYFNTLRARSIVIQLTFTNDNTMNDRYDRYDRDTTICISKHEREKISEAAVDLFGTNEVPYATTVMHLIDRATDIEATN